jgi:AcrR family transcriptional regulator
MNRERGPGGPQPPDASESGAPAGWHGWRGNPDDLWTPFGARPPHAGLGRADRRGADRGRPRLSREEIVDAAIAIADAEGADSLSMRRIAQVLRAGTMSLYWHVANKEHLLDLMRDTLMGEITAPEPSGDWRADLRALAISSRSMLSRHRWLMDFVGGRPALGPTTLISLEAFLALVAPLGLEPAAEIDVLTAVNTYVSGAVLRESQEIRAQRAEQAVREQSLTDARRERQAWRDRLAATRMFPHVVRFLDSGVDPDAAGTRQARFEFGLDCMLDGIAARLGRPD